METKTGKQVHIIMGSGYPKDGSVRPSSYIAHSKKIVSKGEYARVLGGQTFLTVAGSGFYIIAVLCAVGPAGLLWASKQLEAETRTVEGAGFAIFFLYSFSIIVLPILLTCAFFLRRAGLSIIKQASLTDSRVPLTRANTAGLPAPESLVRASSEPVQAQEVVLLRAAAEKQERHEEQLVRASGDRNRL